MQLLNALEAQLMSKMAMFSAMELNTSTPGTLHVCLKHVTVLSPVKLATIPVDTHARVALIFAFLILALA